jgi:hypothetical protein
MQPDCATVQRWCNHNHGATALHHNATDMEPKMKSMTLRFADEEHKMLVARAEERGTTVADAVKAALFGASVEEMIQASVQASEQRIAERIADFRKNISSELVSELRRQQQQRQQHQE